MVGKLQDIVTASVVVGAIERGSSKNLQPDAKNKAIEANSPRFIVDVQGMEAEDDFKEEQEFHLKPGTLDEESVDFMTKELNELMSKINCNLEFTYHQDAGMMSVKMVDKETQEVIKELPPEEMIENMMKAKDWLGAFLDKTI